MAPFKCYHTTIPVDRAHAHRPTSAHSLQRHILCISHGTSCVPVEHCSIEVEGNPCSLMNGQKFCLIVGLKLYVGISFCDFNGFCWMRFFWGTCVCVSLSLSSVCNNISASAHMKVVSLLVYNSQTCTASHTHTHTIAQFEIMILVGEMQWLGCSAHENFEFWSTHTANATSNINLEIHRTNSRAQLVSRSLTLRVRVRMRERERNIHMNVENGLEICCRTYVYG